MLAEKQNQDSGFDSLQLVSLRNILECKEAFPPPYLVTPSGVSELNFYSEFYQQLEFIAGETFSLPPAFSSSSEEKAKSGCLYSFASLHC